MGIFISLYVAHNVTQEEWEPVYEESLKLAKQFCLIDFENTELFGEELFCGIPVKERGEDGKRYWQTIGDFFSMGYAEDQSIPRQLSRCVSDPTEVKTYDPLLAVVPSCTRLYWKEDRCKNSFIFWGNKTQGEVYHMYLLAIGCMIESRLGGKACVAGDITIGQCRKAVELANQNLSEPIGMPVRCELEPLYRRVRNLPIKEEELLEVFQGLYLGALDREYGDFVRTYFSSTEREYYWKRAFKNCRIGSPYFSSTIKTYFNLGNELEELCKIVQYVGKDGTEYYEQFVKEIMRTNLFLKQKDLRDCLEIPREAEAPNKIHTLMAQYTFTGAKNRCVDAFMSIDQISEILCRYLPEHCDVQGIINEYLKQLENGDKDKLSDILNDCIDVQTESMIQAEEAYDIYDTRSLPYYKTGDKIKPELERVCINYLKFYKGLCEETRFSELMKESAEKKSAFLIFQNRELFLMKARWLKIFEDIEKNPDSFRRYYPMVRVRLHKDTIRLVRAYVENDGFYKYCENALASETHKSI